MYLCPKCSGNISGTGCRRSSVAQIRLQRTHRDRHGNIQCPRPVSSWSEQLQRNIHMGWAHLYVASNPGRWTDRTLGRDRSSDIPDVVLHKRKSRCIAWTDPYRKHKQLQIIELKVNINDVVRGFYSRAPRLVRPASEITWWRKSTEDSEAGTASRRQGCPSRGGN